MEFVQQFMATNKSNRICKTVIASGLAFALSDKEGGHNSAMGQVIIIDRDYVLDTVFKFTPIVRINHRYCKKTSYQL